MTMTKVKSQAKSLHAVISQVLVGLPRSAQLPKSLLIGTSSPIVVVLNSLQVKGKAKAYHCSRTQDGPIKPMTGLSALCQKSILRVNYYNHLEAKLDFTVYIKA